MKRFITMAMSAALLLTVSSIGSLAMDGKERKVIRGNSERETEGGDHPGRLVHGLSKA